MTKTSKTLDRVLKEVGGITPLAAACGLTDGAVRYWVRQGRVTNPAAARFLELYMLDNHKLTVTWRELHGKGK
jgi:hypothetical protein